MKSIATKLIAAAALLTMTSGCGALVFGSIDAYEIISGGFDTESETELVANDDASIRFVDVEELANVSNQYGVSFKLNDGGSAEFLLQCNGSLNAGIEVQVTRSGSSYSVEIEGDDLPSIDLPTASDNEEVSLEMTLDNGKPQLLIWQGTSKGTAATAEFDSDDDMPSLAKGSGLYWGISLVSGTLTRAQKTAL